MQFITIFIINFHPLKEFDDLVQTAVLDSPAQCPHIDKIQKVATGWVLEDEEIADAWNTFKKIFCSFTKTCWYNGHIMQEESQPEFIEPALLSHKVASMVMKQSPHLASMCYGFSVATNPKNFSHI